MIQAKEIDGELWIRAFDHHQAIKQALEQPDPEPVAWVSHGWSSDEKHSIDYEQHEVDAIPVGTLLYTSPPKREWQGLTDEEIDQGLVRTNYAMQTAGAWRDGVHWAQMKLKEKNNG